MSHRDFHPDYVENCFGCKTLSVSVSASALENRGGAVREESAREKQLDRDLRGYKEMRDGGLQPKKIDGSSDVVKTVESQFDIDLGGHVPKAYESRVREGYAICDEMGIG